MSLYGHCDKRFLQCHFCGINFVFRIFVLRLDSKKFKFVEILRVVCKNNAIKLVRWRQILTKSIKGEIKVRCCCLYIFFLQTRFHDLIESYL